MNKCKAKQSKGKRHRKRESSKRTSMVWCICRWCSRFDWNVWTRRITQFEHWLNEQKKDLQSTTSEKKDEKKWRLMISFDIRSDWKEERRISLKSSCYSKNIRSTFAAQQNEWNTIDAIINRRKKSVSFFFYYLFLYSNSHSLAFSFFKQNSNLDSYATSTSYSIKLTDNDDAVRSKE